MAEDVRLGPATVNLVDVVENDAWSLSITLTVGGTPYNLTGLTCVATMQVGNTLVPITVVVTNPTAGQLTLSQADAPAVDVGHWALRVGTRTMLAGTVTGRDDVFV